MSKIIEYLYLGSYSDIENNFYKLINTSLIINVAKECEYDVDNNIKIINLKFNDLPTENILHNIETIIDEIHNHITNKKTVFVHCYMGKSRSVSIIFAYLIKHQNFTLHKAYHYVKSIRNICPNIGFIKQLISYEIKLNNVSTLDFDECAVDYISNLLELDTEYVKKIYESQYKDIDNTIDAIFFIEN